MYAYIKYNILIPLDVFTLGPTTTFLQTIGINPELQPPPKKLKNDGLKIGVFWFPRADFTTTKVGSQGCNIKFIRQDSGAKAGGVIF